MIHLGRHIIAEFYNCNAKIINNTSMIETIMTDAAVIAGANIIQPFFHSFSPHGVSGIIVISESHFAIHTWPEHAYAAVDLFTCSDLNYRDSLKHIRDGVESQNYSITQIYRGLSTSSVKELSMIDSEPVFL